MALKPCRECGREVSTEALTCPHCGIPRPTAPGDTTAPRPQPPRTPTRAAPASPARQTAWKALGWIVGVLLAVAGVGALLSAPLAGLLYFMAAAVVLPPVNAWLKRSLNLVIPGSVKALVVLGLIVGAAVYIPEGVTGGDDREAAEAPGAKAQALRADYAAHGPAILEQMDSAIKAHNYSLAVSIGVKYAKVVTDSQLVRRLRDARAEQKRVADSAKVQQLLARVERTPANDLEANRDLYQQLVALSPSNAAYKRKHDDYSNQIRQRDAAEQDRSSRFGPAPQASAWDGTYREVKDYLRETMNDPSSLEGLECTKVYHVERGWLVGCNYRGRNAFGGMIRQANWFIIRQGRVIDMLPYSAYRE